MTRSLPFGAHERPRSVRRSRARPPRRPEPAGEAQRLPRRAGPGHGRGAACGGGPLFSSGMDLASLGSLSEAPERLRTFRRHCLEAWNLAEEMPKPVICAIQGACIGGALELALACDFRVLAADAIVGMPETRIGLIPDVGGSSRLPQVVGLGRAKELIM